MAFKGIDVRATGDRIIFDAFLVDNTGAPLGTGTTNLSIAEVQSDGTLRSYDFNDNTFKTGALTTENQAMTHRPTNNATVTSGIWTHALTTLTGFTAGGMYLFRVRNSTAVPENQWRKFQFGHEQGDLTVTAGLLNVNEEAIDADTTAPTRLVAALTTANGIDLNMGQLTPVSPTADTTGEALRFAHQDLPSQIAAGSVGGLPVVKNADIALLNFTIDTGSTASEIIVPSAALPTGHADDDYNGMLLIIKDVSAGGRINIRSISDYVSSARRLVLPSGGGLGFTPEVSVDIATVWSLQVADLLAELLKLTSGFGASAPNTLYSHIKAMMDKTAPTPSGLGTFSPSTDAIEALRDLLDLMAGAGFLTGTDSLEQIRNAIDNLLAPNVVGSTSLSGSGFLSDCVTCVRIAIDEPSVTPKYTDTRVVAEIQSAFAEVIQDLNTNTDHPIMVRGSISVVSGTQSYQLPPTVGELLRIAKINSTTGLPEWEIWPGSEHAHTGAGFTIEGNTLRLLADWKRAETLQTLYVPNGEAFIHKATASSATTTTVVFPSSVTDGTLDTRANAYAGYMIRILSDSNVIVQERIISAYDNITRTATVSVPFSPTLGGTIVYEVLPAYGQLIKDVVCLYAARSILSNEGNVNKINTITTKLSTKMRALRMQIEKKNGRFLKSFGGDTIDNTNRDGWWGGDNY